ncbi:Lactoylglutathione lyase family protein [Methylocaldum szegediense]|uniref:Lactoylglutathione lyase family protein n=2 Tax=Methylocaldum szegediense TaxID=73780 RepID=A0ABN8X9M4_9GAMM|nr:Lactoylglutathione lyase family protein [Methylocaldum szegediense]
MQQEFVMRSFGSETAKRACTRWLPTSSAVLLTVTLAAFSGCTGRTVELPPLTQHETQIHYPGRIIWHDLLTDDLSGAKRFYGNLFGWQFTDFDSADFVYTIAWNHGHPIAGFVEKDDEQPRPASQWFSLLSVEDVDRAVRQTERYGGSVPLKPITAPERGRFAIIRDPGGALLTVIRTRWGDPDIGAPEENDWFWNELWTEKVDEAALFYRELVGFQARSLANESGTQPYLIFQHNGIPAAGAARLPMADGGPAWLPYVRVSDLDGTVSRAESLGGRILIAPNPNIRSGTVAVIADPSGAIFGIQQIPASR